MDGLENEELTKDKMLMPDIRKGPRDSELHDGLEEDTNRQVQLVTMGNMVKEASQQLHKIKASK